MPKHLRATALLALAAACHGAFAAPRFDRAAWLADFAQLKLALERSYSHLAWMAAPESGVDVPALHERTLRALRTARDDADAEAALLGFVDGFHDGHLSRVSTPEAAEGRSAEPAARPTDGSAQSACAAYGYTPQTRVAFSQSFESLPGFKLLADGLAEPFRSGVVLQGERRIGLVRIPRFRAAEFPALCEHAWRTLAARGAATTAKAVADEIDTLWLSTLAARLAGLRAEGAEAVIVDIGGNGGGNDLGDWSTRLFTARPVRSAPLWVVQGEAGVIYLDEQLGELGEPLKGTALDTAARTTLQQSLSAFEQRKRQIAEAPRCDLSWAWRERRRWGVAKACRRLVDAGFASGPLTEPPPAAMPAAAAKALYWPTVSEPLRGAWTGPVYVLTDGRTGSAAEMFAALMQDGVGARTLGQRTAGLGCGFMGEVKPVRLAHSNLSFRVPNCVRLRRDGSDEVAGIAPDLPLAPRQGESGRARAQRALGLVVAELPVAR